MLCQYWEVKCGEVIEDRATGMILLVTSKEGEAVLLETYYSNVLSKTYPIGHVVKLLPDNVIRRLGYSIKSIMFQ
jgi:hypothetical protein